jgi:hypothetical protein
MQVRLAAAAAAEPLLLPAAASRRRRGSPAAAGVVGAGGNAKEIVLVFWQATGKDCRAAPYCWLLWLWLLSWLVCGPFCSLCRRSSCSLPCRSSSGRHGMLGVTRRRGSADSTHIAT